jgi:putative ABC transport system permease protein
VSFPRPVVAEQAVQGLKTGLVLLGSFVHVLSAADLAVLVLAGLAIAAADALGPASWAAAARPATALRAE